MTPREAVALTAYIQAHFPSQPINEYTPDALWELLADYPEPDCRAAVLTLSRRGDGDRTRWCAPSDVAAEVRRLRSKRLADNPLPPPPPDLTPVETIAWLKEKRRATADGERVEDERGALTQRNLPELRALIQHRPTVPEPPPLLGPSDHTREYETTRESDAG